MASFSGRKFGMTERQMENQQAIIDGMHVRSQMAAHDIFEPDLPEPYVIAAMAEPPPGGFGGIG